jgi:hypothetical protein
MDRIRMSETPMYQENLSLLHQKLAVNNCLVRLADWRSTLREEFLENRRKFIG